MYRSECFFFCLDRTVWIILFSNIGGKREHTDWINMKKIFERIWWFIKRVYLGGVNKRNVFTLALNFFINFSPIFIWLVMFKNAGIIPKDWRPEIRLRFAFIADVYLFGDYFQELGSQSIFWTSVFTSICFAVCVLLLPLGLWFWLYYRKGYTYNVFDETDRVTQSGRTVDTGFRPKRLRVILPFFSLFFGMVCLEVAHLLASQNEENFSKFKDILAWVSYVILHLTAPILTAVYLYVFHAPGTVKCFAFALGLQNICGLLTHLLLPMGPPWFFHLYGIEDTAHANYDQPGYAAGLTRVDGHLGTHLNSQGFHISPIVFGAVPSLHSAMAFQCFLYLVLRSTQTKSKPSNSDDATSVTSDCIPLGDDESHSFIAGKSYGLQEPNLSYCDGQGHNDGCCSNVTEERSGDDYDDDDDARGDFEKGRCSDLDEDTNCSSDDILEDLLIADNSVLSGSGLKIVQERQRLPENILHSKWLWIFHKGLLPRILGSSYILLQWWATQYLDHHFRFDLFVGMIYALVAYQVINVYILQPRVLKPWLQVRANMIEDTANESRTMGMRVFKDTKVEWFFDPLI